MEHFDRHVFAQIQEGLRTVPSHIKQNRRRSVAAFHLRNLLYLSIVIFSVTLWFIDVPLFLEKAIAASFTSSSQTQVMQAIAPFLDAGLHYSVASMLVVLFSTLLYLNVRRYYSGSHFWGTDCPECNNSELVRKQRSFWHRLSGTILQLPIRHFSCRKCSWHGGRIDRDIFQ